MRSPEFTGVVAVCGANGPQPGSTLRARAHERMALTDWLNITRIVAVCILMAAVATWLLWQARSRHGFAPLTAILRAAAQLAALVVILQFMITSVWWVLLWLVVMLVVAALTATRSIGFDRTVLRAVLLSILSGATVGVLVAFATGAVEFGAQYLLAIGGIVIGNAMSVATLSAKRMREQLVDHRDEIFGWLALGATMRFATARFRAEAVRLATTPNIDQSKTTGLVVLPGAFTGAVFAGASPVEAGLFQIVVLSTIMLSSALTAVLVTEQLGSPQQLPIPDGAAA